jgi:predicted protein tyrosine phosphatase
VLLKATGAGCQRLSQANVPYGQFPFKKSISGICLNAALGLNFHLVATVIPIPDSYWVVPDKLLAGEYPGSFDKGETLRKVKAFLDCGVTFFLDLTEDGELRPYAPVLLNEALQLGMNIIHRRFPVRDGSIPSNDQMRSILDAIASAIADGYVVYFHCYGGIGRTGTVAGCWLIDQGMNADEALTNLSDLRKNIPDGRISSPENDMQKRFVEKWRRVA